MPILYDISFTTKKLVGKFDAKGKLVQQEALGSPITLNALPYKTAMSYSDCDNFKIVQHGFEDQGQRKQSGQRKGIGNGTREVDWDALATGQGIEQGRDLTKKPVAASQVGRSNVTEAAQRGDLGAAINAQV